MIWWKTSHAHSTLRYVHVHSPFLNPTMTSHACCSMLYLHAPCARTFSSPAAPVRCLERIAAHLL